MSEMDSRTGRAYSPNRYSSEDDDETQYRRVRSTVTTYKGRSSSSSSESGSDRSRSRSPVHEDSSTDGEISDDDDDDDNDDKKVHKVQEESDEADSRTISKRSQSQEKRERHNNRDKRLDKDQEDLETDRRKGRDHRDQERYRRGRDRDRDRRGDHERYRRTYHRQRRGDARDHDRYRDRRGRQEDERESRLDDRRIDRDKEEDNRRASRKRTRESEEKEDGKDQKVGSGGNEGDENTDFLAKKRAKAADASVTTRTGGAYIPPARLRMMQAAITDKASVEYQRIAWEALKKSINGLINKVNVSNLIMIVQELFQENIVRGRGLLARSIIQAQALSPTFTHVYAALVAIINTKFPQDGELVLKRLILNFKKGFRRNTKDMCLSSTRFLAHLVNQQVAHEIIALEILTLLLENPTDDSVEVAVGFLKESGAKLTEVSPRGIHAIFERLRSILHEGQNDKRVQYMIEVMFATRKDGFKDHPSVVGELDLVEEEDQFTHMLTLEDATSAEEMLNVFKFDPEYEATEEKYKILKKEILEESSSGEESDSGSGSGSDSGSDSDSDEEKEGESQTIVDQTETNLIALRRTIYLTIQSSLDFEECAHKLLKMELKPGQELELCNMILDCCAQQRTFEKFFGLLAQRFCMIDKKYVEPFETVFKEQYESIHRLETNKLRNVGKFFAHLLYSDAINWSVLENIKLNEDDTTSSSRIFIKILFQELSEYLGLPKLNGRLKDLTLQAYFEGLFPRDNPRNTRFAINFFTSIGLGGLTDELRAHLKTKTKQMVQQQQQQEAVESSSSSSDSNSSSSDSDSSSGSSSDSSSSSSSNSEEENSKRKKKDLKLKKNVASKNRLKQRSPSNSPSPIRSRSKHEYAERNGYFDRRHERGENVDFDRKNQKPRKNKSVENSPLVSRVHKGQKQRSVSPDRRDKRNKKEKHELVDRTGGRNHRQKSLSIDRNDQRYRQRSVSLDRREQRNHRERSVSVDRRHSRNHRQRSISVDRKDHRDHRQRSVSVEWRDPRNRPRSVSSERRDFRYGRQRSLSGDRRNSGGHRQRSLSPERRDSRNRRERSLSVSRKDQRNAIPRSFSGDRRQGRQLTRGDPDEGGVENGSHHISRQKEMSPDSGYGKKERGRNNKNRRASRSPSDTAVLDRNRHSESLSPLHEINYRRKDRDPRMSESDLYEDSWARIRRNAREGSGDHRDQRHSNDRYNENNQKQRRDRYDSEGSDSDRPDRKGSDRTSRKQDRRSGHDREPDHFERGRDFGRDRRRR